MSVVHLCPQSLPWHAAPGVLWHSEGCAGVQALARVRTRTPTGGCWQSHTGTGDTALGRVCSHVCIHTQMPCTSIYIPCARLHTHTQTLSCPVHTPCTSVHTFTSSRSSRWQRGSPAPPGQCWAERPRTGRRGGSSRWHLWVLPTSCDSSGCRAGALSCVVVECSGLTQTLCPWEEPVGRIQHSDVTLWFPNPGSPPTYPGARG